MPLLGLRAQEVVERARAHLVRGAGVAPQIYREACVRGRFTPAKHGLGQEAQAAWLSHFALELPKIVHQYREPSPNGRSTVKLVFAGGDGLEFESVLIPMGSGRNTLCVSSQVGCRLGCLFCETGRMGLLRNLEAWEIVSQVVVARAVLGWSVHNIVFMGMGEPLDNPDAVIQALRVLNDDRGLSYGQQKMTICTVGRPEGLLRLAELGWKRLDVSLSLNAGTDALRNRLMPVHKKSSLKAVQEALLRYRPRPKFVFGVNYCLLPGINDTQDDAEAVATFCRPLMPLMLNVIPYNPGTKPVARPPEVHETVRFADRLRALGIPVRRRLTKGQSVMAACGQLGDPEARRRRLKVMA